MILAAVTTRQHWARQYWRAAAMLWVVAFAVSNTFAQDSGVNDTFSQNNVDMQLEVVPGCSVSQPNGSDFGTLNFGTRSLLISTVDQQVTMNFSLQCATGVSANILIDGGGAADVNSRRMIRNGGSEIVTYQLYIDSGRTTIWNNTTGLAVAGNGQSVSYPVYGRVASQANPIVGVYRDTVQVTIIF